MTDHTSTPEVADNDRSQYYIVTNTGQVTVNDLRIGVGNIYEKDYTDSNGQSKHGLTAGLWFFFREDSSLDGFVRAFPGLELEHGGYRVKVHDIAVDGIVLSVLALSE